MDFKYEIEKGEDSKIDIKITIPKEEFEKEKNSQFKKLSKDVSLPGFRPGKGPKDLVEAKIGSRLYDEVMEALIPEATLSVIKEKNWRILTNVNYDIKKFDPETGIEFTATIYVFPEFKLPSFSKIKVKKDSNEVTKEELETYMLNFAKDIEMREGKKTEDFSLEKIDDKWVADRKIPNVKTKKELEEFLKKFLEQEKLRVVEDKYMNDILEKSADMAKIDVPKILVEKEIEIREEENKKRLKELGIEWENWEKQQGEKLEENKKLERENIQKGYKIQFLLMKVGEEADIKVDDDVVKASLKAPQNKTMVERLGEETVETNLRNQIYQQQVIAWVKKQVEGDKKEEQKSQKDSKKDEK
jgi:trigger factor